MKFFRIIVSVASLFVALSVFPSFAGEGKLSKGETSINGYLDFVFYDDRGIGWSGAETTFTGHLKLDVQHAVYDDVLIRFRGEYSPTVNDHARAPASFDRREGNPEDAYMQFSGFMDARATLRFGVVKVPFGLFNTLAIEDRNRPVSMKRWREWDYGIRYDRSFAFTDLSLAVVNGEGREGTDSNSSKSVALRLSFPANGDGDNYRETAQVTNYPNPVNANPNGEFVWNVGLSGYVGNKYTTPIKVKNNHYAVDFKADYSKFSFKGQFTYLEGGFTNADVSSNTTIADLVALYQYSDAVTLEIESFKKGFSSFGELTYGFDGKTVYGVMYEYYDPDGKSNDSVLQKAKQRTVLAVKHDFRPGVTFAFLYTMNNDPAFGKTGNILQTDDVKGDEVLMLSVAMQF